LQATILTSVRRVVDRPDPRGRQRHVRHRGVQPPRQEGSEERSRGGRRASRSITRAQPAPRASWASWATTVSEHRGRTQRRHRLHDLPGLTDTSQDVLQATQTGDGQIFAADSNDGREVAVGTYESKGNPNRRASPNSTSRSARRPRPGSALPARPSTSPSPWPTPERKPPKPSSSICSRCADTGGRRTTPTPRSPRRKGFARTNRPPPPGTRTGSANSVALNTPPAVSGSKAIKLRGLPTGCVPGNFTLRASTRAPGVKKCPRRWTWASTPRGRAVLPEGRPGKEIGSEGARVTTCSRTRKDLHLAHQGEKRRRQEA
jgi:hypothetical protein